MASTLHIELGSSVELSLETLSTTSTRAVPLIDDEITRVEASMERVREYGQALISTVVTGKLDVRGIAVPAIDQKIKQL